MENRLKMNKKNRRFPKFQDSDELICSIISKRVFKKKFNKTLPVDYGIQTCLEFADKFVTTDNPRMCHTGVNHVEGGWPKDVNQLDQEQTNRYRMKQEKDEAYIVQMKGLMKSCEHAVLQNNAINLYDTYFDGLESPNFKQDYTTKTMNIYRDHTNVGKFFSIDFLSLLSICYPFFSVELKELYGHQIILIILLVLIAVSFNCILYYQSI